MAEPAPEAYAASVAAAVQVLRAPGLDLQKVVLARSLLARTRQSLSPEVLLARLGADPSVATYAVPLPVAPGQAPAWLVGATPELLLRKRGAELLSHPLAGSARRSTDAAEDERAAQALLASTKDHDEDDLGTAMWSRPSSTAWRRTAATSMRSRAQRCMPPPACGIWVPASMPP